MILPLLFLSMAPADQGGWVQVSRNGQLTNYVDVRSVRVVAGPRRLRLRQRIDFASALPSGTVSAQYELEISCEARTIALWGGVESDRTGQVVDSRKYSQPPVRPIRPDSVADRVFNFVCYHNPRPGLGREDGQ